jgi:hypothetical protein
MPPKSAPNTQPHSITKDEIQPVPPDQGNQVSRFSTPSSTIGEEDAVRKASHLSIGTSRRSKSNTESSRSSDSPSLLKRLRNQTRDVASRTINRIRRRKSKTEDKKDTKGEDKPVKEFVKVASSGEQAGDPPREASNVTGSTLVQRTTPTEELTQTPTGRNSRFREELGDT